MSAPVAVLVLWNAKARNGAGRAEEFKAALQSAGIPIVEAPGQDDPNTFGSAVAAGRQAATLVAVCGGDGTLNCALPALLAHDIPVLFVASGTANNSARNLNLPLETQALAALVSEGVERRVDVGFANETPFLTVCGIGLSTLINRTTSGNVKRLFGPFAFLFQMLRVAWRSRPFRLQLSPAQGTPIECKNVHQVSVVNGRYFATGLAVTETASLDDGKLDILCVHFRKWWHGFFYMAMFKNGTAKNLAEVTHVQTTDATLFCHRVKKLDVDGDVKEKMPVRFRLKPGALRVIAPASSSAPQT